MTTTQGGRASAVGQAGQTGKPPARAAGQAAAATTAAAVTTAVGGGSGTRTGAGRQRKKRSRPSGGRGLLAGDRGLGLTAGRDMRAAVEDPVFSHAAERKSGIAPMNLLLTVRTSYRSVAGSRRQSLFSDRAKVPLMCEHARLAADAL